MEKALGYVRVSTLKQIKGHSLDYQKSAIEKHCEIKNIKLVKIYTDKGLSGYKFRPNFERMMKNLKGIDYVITHSITRFGRSTQDLLYHIQNLENQGIKFVSVKENFDISTKTGKLLLGMLALIAEFEGQSIKERMEAGREWSKIHGDKKFGRPEAKIDWEVVKDFRGAGVSWTKTAKRVGVAPATLINRARKEGIE